VVPLFRKALDASLECGDMNIASYSSSMIHYLRLVQGDPLNQVAEETKRQLELARYVGNQSIFTLNAGVYYWVQVMQGTDRPRIPLYDDPEKEDEIDDPDLKWGESPAFAVAYWACKAQARLLSGDADQAVEAAFKAIAVGPANAGMIHEAEYYFYVAIVLAAYYEHATPDRQEVYIGILRDCQERYRLWNTHCPENFQCRSALIAAEMYRIQGMDMEAMRFY
jgi:hypothetical protein